MATFLELCDEVKDLCGDSSLDAKIKGFVNRALREVTGTIPVPIPELHTVDTITTTTENYVAMPDEYQRDLDDYVYSTNQNDTFKLLKSYSALQVMFPGMNETGQVLTGVLVGRTFYYQRIPGSADTLRINFFAYPTPLDLDADEPSIIPVHLHEKLLVNKALTYCFTRIEQGLDTKKINYDYHEAEYQKALAELILWVGPPKRLPVPVNDIMSRAIYSGPVFHSDRFW